jgi:hypothetical protein
MFVCSVTQYLLCSAMTVKRRQKEFGLFASRKTTAELPSIVKAKLVLEQMEKDPLGRLGPRTIKERLSLDTGVHLSRYAFSQFIHLLV